MILVLTVLAAFPLGYLLKNRTTAYVTFGLGFAHLFTFRPPSSYWSPPAAPKTLSATSTTPTGIGSAIPSAT